jgi:hypothetical protein
MDFFPGFNRSVKPVKNGGDRCNGAIAPVRIKLRWR